MRALELLILAQLGQAGVGQTVAAETGGERLRHDRSAGRAYCDPVAVQRHLDSAVGAKAGVRVPGDVGEETGREPQPAHRRCVVEQWRDPLVEQIAVLT